MRPVEKILASLDGVVEKGLGEWSAKCPAHEDRSPSLTVKERDDWVVLVHCFAGCSSLEVVNAVGLTMADLYPERRQDYVGQKPTWNPSDLLRVLAHEATVVITTTATLLEGDPLSDEDFERLAQAHDKIQHVRGLIP